MNKKNMYSINSKISLLCATLVTTGSLSAQQITNTDSIPQPKEQNIGVVVVSGRRPVVKLKTDKVTYQISNDAEAKTRSVLEMLRKVPMVTVDGRNNITVNGSTQFKVYIDGRLSTTITRNPSKMLRNMPANKVKNIEVITNPGAQYDAEGSGGVLCIYTKKGEAKTAMLFSIEEAETATTGSVHATAGFHSWGSDVNISHQKKRWSWDMNLNGEYWYSPHAEMTSDMVESSSRQWMQQKSVSKMPGTMGDFSTGYEIDSVRSIHANVSMGWFGIKDSGSPSYMYQGNLWGKGMNFGGNMMSRMDEISFDGSIDYQQTWNNEGRIFLNYKIRHNPLRNDSENKYSHTVALTPAMMQILHDNRSEIREYNTEHTFMSDISIPLAQNHLLNTGIKLTADNSDSDSKEKTIQDNTFIEQKNGCIHFRQHQYITAAYAEWDAKWGIWGMKSGLRYEHTWQKSKYLKGEGTNFSTNYGSIVPSISITAKTNKSNTFGINYNMRIRRPHINELDPYINQSDPTQLVYGNPQIKAQHLHSLALVYTFSCHKLALRMSLDHKWSDNEISQYSTLKADRIHTTYGNVLKNHTTMVNTYASWSMSKNTRLTLNGEVAYSNMRSSMLDQYNTGWQGAVNAGLQQNLLWGIKWATSVEWMSRKHTLQGYESGMTMLSTTLTRSFCNDKWSIALSGTTGLGHGGKMVWESVSRTKDFTNTMRYVDTMQDITLGITYSFGKTKTKKNTYMNPDLNMQNSGSKKLNIQRRGK